MKEWKRPRRRAPNVGDVFAAQLDDGRYGVVRVLATCDEMRSSLVALTPWLDAKIPDLSESSLREILRQYRGRYMGQPAICWFDGDPSEDFVFLGTIHPTDDELALDPQGAYGGKWSRSMVRFVQLEREGLGPEVMAASLPNRVHDRSGKHPHDILSESRFWKILAILDWSAKSDEEILEPAIVSLATLEPEEIEAFQNRLCKQLYLLDGEAYAREIGDFSYGSEYFSADHFIDVRCAVVATGEKFFHEVLADPTKMPKDSEFEALLSLAEIAYRRRTGEGPDFDLDWDWMTFSNKEGWPEES